MLLAAHSKLWGSSNLFSLQGKGNLIIFKCKISILGLSIYTTLLGEAISWRSSSINGIGLERCLLGHFHMAFDQPTSLEPVLQPGLGKPFVGDS